jgi:hypothetical protein
MEQLTQQKEPANYAKYEEDKGCES